MGQNASKMGSNIEQQRGTFCRTYDVPPAAFDNAIAAFKKITGSTTKDMSRKAFIKTLTQRYPEEFATMIFETFDTDGNGSMSLNEFLVYMGLSSGGSLEQKLQGSFMLFDKDHNGELERDEVINCFLTLLYSSLYKREMEANHGAKPKGITISEKQKMEITTVVNEIFTSIDTDGNGTIDIEEFVQGFSSHPELCQPMMQF